MVKGRRFMSSNVWKVRCFLNVVGPNQWAGGYFSMT